MQANGMVAVWLDVAPEHEQDLNDWYEQEHLFQVVDIDGFISGYRYFSQDAMHRYLVLYEAIDETVEPGPGFQGLVANPTPWTTRIRSLFAKQMRNNYRRRADIGEPGRAGAIVTVHSNDLSSEKRPQKPLVALPGCTRYRAFEEASKPGSWLEVYDFTDMDAAFAACSSLTAPPGSRISRYAAIGMPYIRSGS